MGTIHTILQKKYKLFSDTNSPSQSSKKSMSSKDRLHKSLNRDLQDMNYFKYNAASRDNAISFTSFVASSSGQGQNLTPDKTEAHNQFAFFLQANDAHPAVSPEKRNRSSSHSPGLPKTIEAQNEGRSLSSKKASQISEEMSSDGQSASEKEGKSRLQKKAAKKEIHSEASRGQKRSSEKSFDLSQSDNEMTRKEAKHISSSTS